MRAGFAEGADTVGAELVGPLSYPSDCGQWMSLAGLRSTYELGLFTLFTLKSQLLEIKWLKKYFSFELQTPVLKFGLWWKRNGKHKAQALSLPEFNSRSSHLSGSW